MEKGDIRKWQLLSIALDEFIEKGFYGTSTRKIAEKAGISSGLLFHYFKTKEDLYVELFKIGADKMIIDRQAAMSAPDKYVNGFLDSVFEQLASNEFFSKMFVFMDQAEHAKIEKIDIREIMPGYEICEQWVPIIKRGQELGVFREGNPHALCMAFFGAVQGIAQEKVRVPDTPLPEKTWLLDILMKH